MVGISHEAERVRNNGLRSLTSSEYEQLKVDAVVQDNFGKHSDHYDMKNQLAGEERRELDIEYDNASKVASTENVDDMEKRIEEYTKLIYRPGFVQSHGVVLCIEEGSHRILATSENSETFLRYAPEELLGSYIKGVISAESYDAVAAASAAEDMDLHNPILIRSRRGHEAEVFLGVLHRTEEGLVLDIERRGTNPDDPAGTPVLQSGMLGCHQVCLAAVMKLRDFADRVDSRNLNRRGESKRRANFESTSHAHDEEIRLLSDCLAKEVNELIGYDRVMVYMLHPDAHGEVIAENLRPGVDSFLGLHWPATDLPQVNRRLFDWMPKPRLLVDCTEKPARVAQVPEMKQNALLGGSQLRATLACHVRYLSNMNVKGAREFPHELSVADSPLLLTNLSKRHI